MARLSLPASECAAAVQFQWLSQANREIEGNNRRAAVTCVIVTRGKKEVLIISWTSAEENRVPPWPEVQNGPKEGSGGSANGNRWRTDILLHWEKMCYFCFIYLLVPMGVINTLFFFFFLHWYELMEQRKLKMITLWANHCTLTDKFCQINAQKRWLRPNWQRRLWIHNTRKQSSWKK